MEISFTIQSQILLPLLVRVRVEILSCLSSHNLGQKAPWLGISEYVQSYGVNIGYNIGFNIEVQHLIQYWVQYWGSILGTILGSILRSTVLDVPRNLCLKFHQNQ